MSLLSEWTHSACRKAGHPGAQTSHASDHGKGKPAPQSVKLDTRNRYIVYSMHRSRWQHLDLEPLSRARESPFSDTGRAGLTTGPEARAPGKGEFFAPAEAEFRAPDSARFRGPSDPADRSAPLPAPPAPPTAMVSVPAAFRHPDLREALGCWRLGQLRACREQLASRLTAGGLPPGGRGLLGLCRGQEGDIAGALVDLTAALAEAPEDELLQAAALSARLRLGLPALPADTAVPDRAGRLSLPDARRSPPLPSAPEVPRIGPLGELLGAAAWHDAQECVRRNQPAPAAREFRRAAEQFQLASPAAVLADRMAAAYFGYAASLILADRLDAAQLAWSNLGGAADLPAASLAFARQVYELADALRGQADHERREVLAPLREWIVTARLRVEFYDGHAPVRIRWEEL